MAKRTVKVRLRVEGYLDVVLGPEYDIDLDTPDLEVVDMALDEAAEANWNELLEPEFYFSYMLEEV